MNRFDILPPRIEPRIEHSHKLNHKQELPRPYQCHLCDRTFSRLEHQTRHVRTHTGEKPHRCSFPGCIKRFSRSDELTRHVRIHNNPNSRRSVRMLQQHQTTTIFKGKDAHLSSIATIMPPPKKNISKSAPVSTIGSPTLSPMAPYSSSEIETIPPISIAFHEDLLSQDSQCSSNSVSLGNGSSKHLDMNLLASAASKVEQDNPIDTFQTPRFNRSCCNLNTYKNLSQLPSPSYIKSRTHTLDNLNHCIKRYMKRSRQNSPNSTAPSSPTFSHDSLSPTPDDTPLMTPAHSPRLRSQRSGYDLPSLRNLSLCHQQLPALQPMEPRQLDYLYHSNPSNHILCGSNTTKTGSSLSDIIMQTDGFQRKLPFPQYPRVSFQDLFVPNESEY